MLKASWKSLLGHKVRMLMSAFAIVLGVAFVSGSLLFTEMMSASITGLMKGTIADVNVDTKGTYDSDATTAMDVNESPVTRDLMDEVAEVDGVSAVHGLNYATTLYPLNDSGKLVGSAQAPTITVNYFDAPAAEGQTGITVEEGHIPGDGEVMLDPTALERSGFDIGDYIPVLDITTGDATPMKIVGTATWASGSTFGATYMFISDEQSQAFLSDGEDTYQSMWVVTDATADPEQVASDINEILPENLQALSSDKVSELNQEVLAEGLSFINTFLLVFAAIALVVATFLIVNTFSIIVAQRGRELALLRAMGASRVQVRGSVLFEATIVGLLGATLGIGLGWVLAMSINVLMAYFGMDLGGTIPSISPTVLGVAYGVGLIVTLVAAFVPAARASRVPPIAAMTGDYQTGKSGLGKRAILSAITIGIGAVLMAGGLGGWLPEALRMVGIGALLVLLGVASASPLLGWPVTWTLGRLYRVLFGSVGQLAELNASRNPRRTAATASALMIGLALVVTMSILGQSTKVSVSGLVETTFRGDLTVSSLVGTIAPKIGDDIEEVEGVDKLYRTRSTSATIDDENTSVFAMEAGSFDKTVEITMDSGSMTDVPGEAVVEKTWAEKNGYSVGSEIDSVMSGHDVPLTVTGIYTVPDGVRMGELMINFATWDEAEIPVVDNNYTLYLESGADLQEVWDRIDDATADQPLITVNDVESTTAQATANIDQILAIIYALLALAVVIAVLGIVNTLALSVIERTREIGLLRAIGLTRGQLRGMVTLESVVVALLGAFLGVGLGLVFGVSLQRLLGDQGLDQLAIPWGLLATFLVVSILVGILAAVWPARRASKMDVLQAIATE